MTDKKEWTADKFSRRRYTVEGPDLDKARKIELIVKIDGKTMVHMQAREPGIVAFVSKPLDQGFEIDIVEAGGKRYSDVMAPDSPPTKICPWQLDALEIKRSDG